MFKNLKLSVKPYSQRRIKSETRSKNEIRLDLIQIQSKNDIRD